MSVYVFGICLNNLYHTHIFGFRVRSVPVLCVSGKVLVSMHFAKHFLSYIAFKLKQESMTANLGIQLSDSVLLALESLQVLEYGVMRQ